MDNYFTDVNDVVMAFRADRELLPRTKAGLWQGSEAFKDLDMYVLRDITLKQIIPFDKDSLHTLTRADLPWAEGHFQERIRGKPTNPGETYKYWPYHNNLDNSEFKDEKFSHTYQERFWPKKAGEDMLSMFARIDGKDYNTRGIRFEYGDYNDVVKQLGENPLTRQAYLPIFFPEDTGAKNNIRVPCTLGYLFEIIGGQLNMTYYIRSCDVFRHFRNDVYLAGRLIQHTQCLLFNNYNLKLEPGILNMKIANLHLFINDAYPLTKKERNGRI
jgi:hypothetical protein